jgi:hypothetical protein
MVLLWLFARHEAELSYFIIFYVVAGITLLAFLASLFSIWAAIVIYIIGLPLAIARFCYISLPKALLVTLLFVVIQVGVRYGMEAIAKANFEQT